MAEPPQWLSKSSGSPVLEQLDQLEALTYSILEDSSGDDDGEGDGIE